MRFLLPALVAFSLLGCTNGSHQHADHSPAHATKPTVSQDSDSTTSGNPYPRYCLVMGGKLPAKSLSDPALHVDYEGKRYHFCCKQCKPDFEKTPDKWIAEPAKPQSDGHAGHQH